MREIIEMCIDEPKLIEISGDLLRRQYISMNFLISINFNAL